MSIFTCEDIDIRVLEYLDLLDDYPTVKLINWHYYKLVVTSDVYCHLMQLKAYESEKDDTVRS